jgi:hypothetical protein
LLLNKREEDLLKKEEIEAEEGSKNNKRVYMDKARSAFLTFDSNIVLDSGKTAIYIR